MTIRKVLIAFGIAVTLQGTAFAWQYRDLLYLRQPVSDIARDQPATFAEHATTALSRSKLTRQHLETIAEAARRFGRSDLEVQALDRRFVLDPNDPQVRIRLGDALRRANRFEEAEQLYSGVLQVRNEQR